MASDEVKNRLKEYLSKISADLDRTVAFWVTHSKDQSNGGFFQCLETNGDVYDTNKYCWLLSRQVWTFARLHNQLPRFANPEIKEMAIKGAEFVLKHVKHPNSMKCFFSLTQDGQPIKVQSTIFSECFYLMAMSEMFILTKEERYRTEALSMMTQIEKWVREDDSGLGRPLTSPIPTSSLAVPMMLLCLVDQLEAMDSSLKDTYQELADWCVESVRSHVQRDNTVVLENVHQDGTELPGSAGRLMCPGHAIESGWFLLKRVMQGRCDPSVARVAIDAFILGSFSRGWDQAFGGLFYFLDVDGRPTGQLEWDMKLWWPHNETMIASLMAYTYTKQERFLAMFQQVFEYCQEHFVDNHHGEWFGYLSREGNVKIQAKGGPWKGCFHVPRALMMCEALLTQILADMDQTDK